MRNQLPLLMPPTTSLLSMECSVFFTLDLSEPKRHEAEMENERLRLEKEIMIFKILFIPVVFDYKGMKRFLKRENYFTDICLTFANKLKPSVLLQFLDTHLEDVLDEFICGFILEFG